MGDLRTKRIQADYRLSKTTIEDQKTAQAIVKQVEKMINILDTCCQGNQLSNIKAAIKQYEEKTGG